MARFGNELKKLVGNLENFALALTSTGPPNVAEGIAKDLQNAGPAWSGQFRNAWVIKRGDAIIDASRPDDGRDPTSMPRPDARQNIVAPRFSVGGTRVIGSDEVFFTVGNEMEYRDIALDLVPGRIKSGGNETAVQDWFVTYMQGGGLERRMGVEIDIALRSVRL